MPFNGSGTFTPHSPEYPVVAGTTIRASDWNTIVSDIASGLTNAICRDGQSSPSANINWGGFKLTNLAAATAATDAVNLGQMTGRLINVQVINATGIYTPTVSTTSVIVELLGGGGAGGGTILTAAGQVAAGGGAGSGGIAISRLVAGFAGVTVTIGAAGIPVAGANGGAGGTTSFGAVFSAGGGNGGGGGSATSSGNVTFTGGGLSGFGSSGNILNAHGSPGFPGTTGTTGSIGGNGGGSLYGGGGLHIGNVTSAGQIGTSAGAGGGGASAIASSAAQLGGFGVAGLCIIWEFA